MDLQQAKNLAKELIKEHVPDWHFKFDNAKRRFGLCNFTRKTISMSKEMASLNDEAQVRLNLLHEIAHALVGPGHHHDRVWKAQCRAIGGDGKTKYSGITVNTVKGKYVYECPHCKKEVHYHRKKRATMTACGNCCREHNNGRFSERFILVKKGGAQ